MRSLINLQGKLDCQYVVGFYYSSKAQRAHLRDRWPASVEENLERLADAGFPYDRQIPKCANCGGEYDAIAQEQANKTRDGTYCSFLQGGAYL